MKIQYIPIIAVLLLLFLVGPASAVSNTYTQNGTWTLSQSLNTSNTYDSSKINSVGINITPSVTHANPDNISGLITRLKFNDGSGTNIVNNVNTSNNGTASGAVTWGNGKYNGAGVFNTNNTSTGRVLIKNPVLGATAFTFSCWMNANYTLYASPFVDYGTNKNIIIAVYDPTTMRFYVGDGTNVSYSVSNSNWTANSWHMVTTTYNATTNRMALWIDEKKVSATAAGSSGPVTHVGNVSDGGGDTHCALGYYQFQSGASQGYLNGSLDDVCFWNRSLTDAEITSLYYSDIQNVTVKSNANSNSVAIPDNGGNVNIPYSAGDSSVTSINATVPSSVTSSSGVVINDYQHTVSPISYGLTVVSSQEYSPIASFTNSPASGVKPLAASFTDTSSNYPTSWVWNFGDGGTSTSKNPSHTYTTAGTYTVTLTASNSQGSSTISRMCISIEPAAGESGVINTGKRIAIYIENTERKPLSHDTGFGSMLHEYNITYLTNSTIAGNLSTANFDLLVVGNTSSNSGYGVCSNSSAHYINSYIANGGCVWFFSDPLNETNTYMTNMSNATWELPTNRFYCLGTLDQLNVTIGQTLSINTTDSATNFISSPQTILTTNNLWTNGRNFGSIDGINAYGYRYTELIYNGNSCYLAKIWNTTTGSRVVYSNLQDFLSGGECSYFNASVSSRLFNNMKQWVLRLDNNTMQVSVTYPRGDKQFICCYDDINMSAPVANMDDFFNMIDAQPNDIGITSFVIPTGRQNPTALDSMTVGYDYLTEKNVDTNTIHPHQNDIDNPSPDSVNWGSNNASLADMQAALTAYMQNYSIGINNNPSLKFYSIRMPQTKINATAAAASVNLGFKIDSDYGRATTAGTFRDYYTNTRVLQSQVILYGMKTSQIEIESPATFDTGYVPGTPLEAQGATGWISACEAEMPRFFAVDFPAVYSINGHWQWSMTNATWINANRDMLWHVDNRTSYTAYTDFATLAKYEIAIQEAAIRVDTSGSTTTATIDAKYPIKDFTLKLQNINSGITVSLDGRQLTADHVVYEDNVYYVFADIPTGTHTLTVTDAAVSGAKYIGKNGAVSVNISNGAFVKNNAATTKVAVTSVLSPYTNCTNNMTASGNTVSLGAHNMSQQLMATFIPSGGNVTVEVNSWNNTYKKWTENSATHNATMDHWIGGFMPDQYTVLKIDGVVVGEYTASDEGYIAFRYDAGYSEHTFETVTNNPADFDVTIAPKDTISTLKTVSVNATGMSYEKDYNLLGSVVAIVTDGYSLGAILLIVLGMYCVVRYLRGEM